MKSEKIEIRTGGASSQALVGRALMAMAGELAGRTLARDRCAIIADSNSARLFGQRVQRSFEKAKIQATLIVVPAGEKSKSLREVERVCGKMQKLDRGSFVVGLGGGMVGDLSGFVAAIFQRGIPHIQIPTTLLAMVDSAIGGKNGVNLRAGKNLLGAIHQPALIIADLEALEKLPAHELRQGFAEIIKHAIIADAKMFNNLSSRAPKAFGARDDKLIARNIRIKAGIVAQDERDISGARAILNFGHTVGHGIEQATNFQISHGDCVSMGMVAACNVSIKRAGLTRREHDEIVALLKKFDLPTNLPAKVDRRKILAAIARDKKFTGGEVRFVVTPKIGEAFLSRAVTMPDIREAVAAL